MKNARSSKRQRASRYFHLLLILACLPLGCSVLPGHWRPGRNQPLIGGTPKATAASWKAEKYDREDGRFVALALSGGGSRSANFSAAVMLELQRLQILSQVDVISGVSGGALTGAYYGLFPDLWDPLRENDLRQVFRYNMQKNWLNRWFLPQNVFRYWLSDFTRSDIMVQVFNAHWYHDATFADLKAHPKILINATLRNDHSRFTFTDERFNENLHSDLARYGVANAVNASSAFPGAFDDVTLQQYTDPPQYLHLYDGGPRDNLGIQAVMEYLLRAVSGTNLDTIFPNGCLIIVVDAAPSSVNERLYNVESDREFVDYFVNTNAIDASDSMLNALRETILNATGIRLVDHEVFGDAPLPDLHQCRCEVRHIALRHLLYRSDLPENDDFIKRVTRIKTKFWVSDEEQDDLFKAAHLLTTEMSAAKLLPADPVTKCGIREKRTMPPERAGVASGAIKVSGRLPGTYTRLSSQHGQDKSSGGWEW